VFLQSSERWKPQKRLQTLRFGVWNFVFARVDITEVFEN
jgi:hypothetical protein